MIAVVNPRPPTIHISQLSASDTAQLKCYFSYAVLTLDLGFSYETWLAGHYLAFTAKEPRPSPSSFMQFMHETYADVTLVPSPAAAVH